MNKKITALCLPYVIFMLAGCGATNATVSPIEPSPTMNIAATATRSAELSQVATALAPTATPVPSATPSATATPNATATPTIRKDQSPLTQGSTAMIPGAFRVTILQLSYTDTQATLPIRTMFVTLRIENIGTSTVQYTPCSFTLRDGNNEDNDTFACNDRSMPQGPFLVNGGGSRVETVKLAYYKDRGLRSVRFIPVTPTDTLLIFGLT